ncbi:MAG: hypothetical protein ACR2ME_04895 [Acidimicrobiia bacterium]
MIIAGKLRYEPPRITAGGPIERDMYEELGGRAYTHLLAENHLRRVVVPIT